MWEKVGNLLTWRLGLAGSFTLGCGQFCTKPGLVIVVGSSENFESFLTALLENAKKIAPAEMLTEGILENYKKGCKDFVEKGTNMFCRIYSIRGTLCVLE